MRNMMHKTLIAGAMALTVGAGIAAVPNTADARGFGGFHGGGFGGHGFGGRGFAGRGFAGRGFGYRGFGGRFGYGYGRGFGYRRFGYGLGGGLLLGGLAATSYYGACGPYGYGYYGYPSCRYYY